jgi:very-short-patch-repair endonuclease
VIKKKTKKQLIQDKIIFLEDLGIQYAKDLVKNKTKWEVLLMNILKELNYPFQFQVPVIANKSKAPQLFILDFVLSPFNLVIEVDSKEHHSSSKDVKSDNRRTKLLKQEGYTILRFWNKQLERFTKEDVHTIIAQRIIQLKLGNTNNNT